MGSMKRLIWNGLYQATKQCFTFFQDEETKEKEGEARKGGG